MGYIENVLHEHVVKLHGRIRVFKPPQCSALY